jgi:hypothetical protein
MEGKGRAVTWEGVKEGLTRRTRPSTTAEGRRRRKKNENWENVRRRENIKMTGGGDCIVADI